MKKPLLFIFFFFLSLPICYSQYKLSGKIIEKTERKELKYVYIAIKNKSNGTFSDETGNFNINFEKLKDTLILSCIGYKKVELFNIEYDTVIVKMEKDTIFLDEVKIKPVVKNCKKVKIKYKETKFNEVLFEGTIIRRKIELNYNYLCGFSFNLISNYNAKIILRPYLTDLNNNTLFSNDYLIEENLIKNKLIKINFSFIENLSLNDGFYYLGLEVISLPNNNNYTNNIQILCSDDIEKNSDVLSIYNFIQQNQKSMNFDKKLDNNIKLEIIVSK